MISELSNYNGPIIPSNDKRDLLESETKINYLKQYYILCRYNQLQKYCNKIL